MAALTAALWLLKAAQAAAGSRQVRGGPRAQRARRSPVDQLRNLLPGPPFYARTRVVVAGTGELGLRRNRLDPGRWFNEDPASLGAMADRLKAESLEAEAVLAKAANWKRLSAEEKARWEEVARNPAAVAQAAKSSPETGGWRHCFRGGPAGRARWRSWGR